MFFKVTNNIPKTRPLPRVLKKRHPSPPSMPSTAHGHKEEPQGLGISSLLRGVHHDVHSQVQTWFTKLSGSIRSADRDQQSIHHSNLSVDAERCSVFLTVYKLLNTLCGFFWWMATIQDKGIVSTSTLRAAGRALSDVVYVSTTIHQASQVRGSHSPLDTSWKGTTKVGVAREMNGTVMRTSARQTGHTRAKILLESICSPC